MTVLSGEFVIPQSPTPQSQPNTKPTRSLMKALREHIQTPVEMQRGRKYQRRQTVKDWEQGSFN